jgi:hypothetical protein
MRYAVPVTLAGAFAIPNALGREALPPRIGVTTATVTFMDARTEELRAAHDVLSEFYAERLADALDHMPEDRAVLGLFCELVLGAGIGARVGDIGCGTGRTAGLGVEFDIYWLSPDEMERRTNDAGFPTVFWGGIPPEKAGASTQGYLIARKA